jgi:hypothetical protein
MHSHHLKVVQRSKVKDAGNAFDASFEPPLL